ncbi:MAG: leucine-rich repeat protein [Oscillospiraceae bacterium]|nr:leucine-rich repeat protein [Oscillospiraceae bacterium]
MHTLKHRTLALIMSLIMILVCFAEVTFSVGAETNGDYEYEVLDDDTVSITKYQGKDKKVIIPSEIDGKKVTSIGSHAFDVFVYAQDSNTMIKLMNINEIVIPSGVTKIGDNAFAYLFSLKKITVSDTVTSIGNGAFLANSSLENIVLPDSLISIGDMAFSGTSLKKVNIPESVANIGVSAFFVPEKTKEEANKVITILKNLGFKCKTVSNDLIEINVDEKNKNYSSENGVLFNKSKTLLVAYPCGLTGEYTIPVSVCEINKGAFIGSKLSKITVSGGVRKIGKEAFSYSEITNIIFFDGVECIEELAFDSCRNLTNVAFPISLTEIGDRAFYNCLNLINITISASVAKIGELSLGYFDKFNNVSKEFECYKISSLSFYGYPESVAEKYAITNGFKFISYPICRHLNVETLNETKATCTKGGFSGDKRCAVCGLKLENGNEVKPIGHVEERIIGKSATCTEKGLTDGAKCSVCGKVTKEQKEIPALGHSFKDGVCTVCGAIDSNYKLMLNSDSKLILSEKKAMIFGIPESTGGMTAGDFKSQISNKINIGIDDSAIITNGLKFSFGNTEYSIILKGDVNADGKITAKDARSILRIAARLEQPDDVTKEAADVDSDGKVTSKEARSVLRFAAKLQNKIYE